MSVAYLLEAMRGYGLAALGWIAAHDAGTLAVAGIVLAALLARHDPSPSAPPRGSGAGGVGCSGAFMI